MSDPWKSLYRRLPEAVYRNWEEAEKQIAKRFDLQLGDKLDTPGAWTELYERLGQHILQMSEKDWRNF
jgi:hypothetical protein